MKREDPFVRYVVEQLAALGEVEPRAMFGGYGVYHDGVFFAIVDGGRLFFKTDGASRAEYESRGMGPFRPTKEMTLRSYYEVPAEVLESPEELALWARRALACRAGRP